MFATGTALSLLFQAMKFGNPGNVVSDGFLLAFGLLLQVALAYALNHTVAMRAAMKTRAAA